METIEENGETIAEIAENEEEAFWEQRRLAAEKDIQGFKDSLKLAEAFMEKIEERLENATKDTTYNA